MSKYLGFWGSYEEMAASFSSWNDKPVDGMATDDEVLIAMYGGECYEGWATVLFERGGKLYEVNGSHCSCFGLEDQWQPEETTWAALALRKMGGYEFSEEEIAAWDACVKAHQ